MVLIGYAESERVAYKTGLYVIHCKRAKCADPEDATRGVITAPPPGDVFDTASGRSRCDISFIAKVVADKVENAIPLERQARIFGNEKLPVAASTLEDLYKRTADLLKPLYDRMVALIMLCEILHVDETFIKLLVKGLRKCKNAFLRCRLTGIGPPMIAFHFSPSRSQDTAGLLPGNYSGTILRDSSAGYGKLECEAACCWAHVRRYLLDAYNNGYLKVEPLLNIIRGLYKIGNEAKVRAERKGTDTALFQERKTARRTSVKLADEFFAQAKALQQAERPSAPVAKHARPITSVSDIGSKTSCRNFPPLRRVRSIPCCLRSGSRSPDKFSENPGIFPKQPMICISLGAYLWKKCLISSSCRLYSVNSGLLLSRSQMKFALPSRTFSECSSSRFHSCSQCLLR